MIGSVRGLVIERAATGEVLVEVAGVGYRVHVPLGAIPALEAGAPAFLFTHLHVREDAMILYGFPTRDERDTFEALIGANGVGPKLALAILSVHSPNALRRCLAHDDLDALTLVPGVGKRTAQRLVVELKARLEVPDLDLTAGAASSSPATGAQRGAGGARRARIRSRGGARRPRPTLRRGHRRRAPAGRAAAARGFPMTDGAAGREELMRPSADPAEIAEETTLRPRRLAEFVGQPRLREHLEIMLAASAGRGQAMDHVLLAGPPGLGKTTLAGIVAAEMGARLQPTSGPALERAGDLAAILTNLDDGDVLFIDEVHRLPRTVEEVLYPAMEDFQLDIVIGKGPSARTIRLDLPRFTLVGATTRTGLITGPLRDRFGFVARLDYYDEDELALIITRTASILGVELEAGGATEIASRARGTPRIANRLLRRVRDYAEVRVDGRVDGGDGAHRPRVVRGRRARPRQGRPRHPQRAVSHVRGPCHRPRDARRRGRRGAGDRRRRVRAVPAAVRLARAHAPGADRHRGGLRPPRLARHRVGGGVSRSLLTSQGRTRPNGSEVLPVGDEPTQSTEPAELVQYEVRERIAHVTIANGKANALSPDVLAQLEACLTRAESAGESEVGALLITGTPGMLSGGFDLAIMRSGGDAAGRLVTDGGAFIARMFGAPVPVVVACPGHAIAAGALLMLGADYRVGARGAFRIGLIETQLGMILPRWATELARERLSVRHFQQATVGARVYDPDGAVDAGFLDAAVAPEELLDAARTEAARWADLPRAAYHGQVRMNRGERLSRLAEAVAEDRGRGFDVPS